jgi:hypothetical protein
MSYGTVKVFLLKMLLQVFKDRYLILQNPGAMLFIATSILYDVALFLLLSFVILVILFQRGLFNIITPFAETY